MENQRLKFELSCGITLELDEPTLGHLERFEEMALKKKRTPTRELIDSLAVLNSSPVADSIPFKALGEVDKILSELFRSGGADPEQGTGIPDSGAEIHHPGAEASAAGE